MLILEPPAQVADHVWMLGTAAYPLYLVRSGGQAAIIEGGISALGPVLRVQLAQLGVGPSDVGLAIVTHAHPDHVMAVPGLRAMFPELAVVASTKAAATLGVEKAVGFFRQIDTALTGALHAAGKIAEVVPPPEMENRIAIDRTVAEGDTISIGDSRWSVLETPGHSDCSISLFDQPQGVLIISDASGYYMPASQTWWPNYFTGYKAYVASLERLAGLKAEVLCLSHNGVVSGADDVAAYFAGTLAATRAYHQRIIDETKAGKTTRQLAETLGNEIHAQTGVLPADFFQKNCGLLVKQSLKAEGIGE